MGFSEEGLGLAVHGTIFLFFEFEDAGRTHASTYTHGDQSILDIATFHLVYDLYRKLGTSATQRMAQSYSAI